MKTIFKWAILYLILFAGVTFSINHLGVEFGDVNFWTRHGLFFLFFGAVFPRLTMLMATPWGGFFWWISLFFLPRFLMALLATLNYWNTNPVLVMLAWIFAIGGETTEKYWLGRRSKFVIHTNTSGFGSRRPEIMGERRVKDVKVEVQ